MHLPSYYGLASTIERNIIPTITIAVFSVTMQTTSLPINNSFYSAQTLVRPHSRPQASAFVPLT